MKTDSTRKLPIPAEDFTQFARMAFWSAAFDLATGLKDRKSGFAFADEKIKYARAQLRFLYRHAKFIGFASEVLPFVRETVNHYRR